MMMNTWKSLFRSLPNQKNRIIKSNNHDVNHLHLFEWTYTRFSSWDVPFVFESDLLAESLNEELVLLEDILVLDVFDFLKDCSYRRWNTFLLLPSFFFSMFGTCIATFFFCKLTWESESCFEWDMEFFERVVRVWSLLDDFVIVEELAGFGEWCTSKEVSMVSGEW